MSSTIEAIGTRVLREPATFMVLVAIWLALLAWMRPLALPDEGRYLDIARWMAESGDWIVPRVNGLPFLHKPPLYFWLEAGAIQTLGLSPFVGRLVSIASAVAMCSCVLWVVRRTHDDASARWSVAALALNPLFYGGAQFANLDMLVAALITVTIVLGFVAVTSPTPERPIWCAAYVSAAFAVLAKGLIGVLIPGLVLVAWAFACRRPSLITKAISPAGALLFAIIVAPWFVAVETRYPGFVRYFIGYHHIERFLESGFNNRQGVWFYPAVLVGAMLPWTVAPLINWRTAMTARAPELSLHTLAGVWFVVVLVFFSIPPSKLVGYIFPLLPAFAIFIGPWFATYRYRRATAVIGALLCVSAVPIATFLKPTGPLGLATTYRTRIAAADRVVFLNKYFFDAAVALDRRMPIYVKDDWSKRADQLPDNIHRQFTEGREFEAASGRALIGKEELDELLGHSQPVWIFAEESAWLAEPKLQKLARVASEGRFVLLRAN
jgi:4-amino-4-deoxy-L-arabinose transferase-like glycosyltransferase